MPAGLDRPVDYTSVSWPLEHRLVLRARVAPGVPTAAGRVRDRAALRAAVRVELAGGAKEQVRGAETAGAASEAARVAALVRVDRPGSVANRAHSVPKPASDQVVRRGGLDDHPAEPVDRRRGRGVATAHDRADHRPGPSAAVAPDPVDRPPRRSAATARHQCVRPGVHPVQQRGR
jgi:hypothetical protein